MLLENKVAIVTGSSRGIGASCAKLLAENGAKVVVNYTQNRESGEQVLSEITAAGDIAILVQADVTELDQVQAMVQRAELELGSYRHSG